MKTNEFKLRIVTAIDELIDVYFAENDLIDKMVNSTLKLLVKTNSDKIDSALGMFANEQGEIDATTIVNTYADNINPEGVSFSLRQYVKNDFIRNILPDKTLIISKEDILKIINGACEEVAAPIPQV